jgi:hypothetical protein
MIDPQTPTYYKTSEDVAAFVYLEQGGVLPEDAVIIDAVQFGALRAQQEAAEQLAASEAAEVIRAQQLADLTQTLESGIEGVDAPGAANLAEAILTALGR